MCILISYQKLNLSIFIRFATSVPHREILFQNDAYTSKGTVQLRANEFGVFYVFVVIDRYNRVSVYLSHPHFCETPKREVRNDFVVLQISDIDSSNNMLLADSPVQVSLTPPPNLKVKTIVFPSPSFSGEELCIMPLALLLIRRCKSGASWGKLDRLKKLLF